MKNSFHCAEKEKKRKKKKNAFDRSRCSISRGLEASLSLSPYLGVGATRGEFSPVGTAWKEGGDPFFFLFSPLVTY